MQLTTEQIASLKAGEPFFPPPGDFGLEIVVLSKEEYLRLAELSEEAEDQALWNDWIKTTSRARNALLRDDS